MLAVGVLDEDSSAGAFSRRAAFLLVQDLADPRCTAASFITETAIDELYPAICQLVGVL